MARSEIVQVVPNKRCIGRNRVPTLRRCDSCLVEEASKSENSAVRVMKPGIDLIIMHKFDLVSGIRSGIPGLNIAENTNKPSGVLAVHNDSTTSFTDLP